jgi:hypothetical protein
MAMKDDSYAAVIRALDDLHSELEKTSRSIDRDHAGPTKCADQRIYLIREYSQGVARILDTFTAVISTQPLISWEERA